MNPISYRVLFFIKIVCLYVITRLILKQLNIKMAEYIFE